MLYSWRDEQLFRLKVAVELYDFYAEQLAACDQPIPQQMEDLARYELKPEKPQRRGGQPKNAPKFDARILLMQMRGVDLTRIDGIDVTTAFKVLSEIGADRPKFKSAKHFASWLGLCPGTKISGRMR